MTALVVLLFAIFLHHPPTVEQIKLAWAIADVETEQGPIFDGERGAEHTVSVMSAVAYRESGLRLDAVGDGGRSVCAFQILGGAKVLLTDAHACAEAGYQMLKASVRACPSHPVAVYARGRCDSVQGRRISDDRMALAKRGLAEASK